MEILGSLLGFGTTAFVGIIGFYVIRYYMYRRFTKD